MKYFVSFSQMDADFASKAAINRPETIDEMEERRELLFENSAFFHKIVGLWPKEDQLFGNFRALKCRAGIVSSLAITLMQYSVLAVNEDKSRMAEFSIEAAISTTMFIKILPCILKWKKLVDFYHKTLEINGHLKESSAEKKIAYKWLSLQNKLISSVIISYLSSNTMYLLYQLLRGFAFPITPSIIPKALYKLPWNVLVNVLEFITSYLRLTILMSCDIYLIVLMCQVCSELQIVGNAMLEINANEKQSIFRAIEKHKRALEYGQLICNEFSPAIVVQHIVMSIAAAFSAISVLYTEDEGLVFQFAIIGFMIATELLLLCFIGETIAEESVKIADYLEIKFAEFLDDAASLKTISFMLLRAQRPLSLRVGVNTIMNLSLFRITMNKIVSCFLILKRAMAE